MSFCVPVGSLFANPNIPGISLLVTNKFKDTVGDQKSLGGTDDDVIIPIYFPDVFNYEYSPNNEQRVEEDVLEWFREFPFLLKHIKKVVGYLCLDAIFHVTNCEIKKLCAINFVNLYLVDDLHELLMSNSKFDDFRRFFVAHVDSILNGTDSGVDLAPFESLFPEECLWFSETVTSLKNMFELATRLIEPDVLKNWLDVYRILFVEINKEAHEWKVHKEFKTFPSFPKYVSDKHYLTAVICGFCPFLTLDDVRNLPSHSSDIIAAVSVLVALENDMFSYDMEFKLSTNSDISNPMNLVFAKIKRDGLGLKEAFADVAQKRNDLIRSVETTTCLICGDERSLAMVKVMQFVGGLLRMHCQGPRYGWKAVKKISARD